MKIASKLISSGSSDSKAEENYKKLKCDLKPVKKSDMIYNYIE